jgi:hypothetical protein
MNDYIIEPFTDEHLEQIVKYNDYGYRARNYYEQHPEVNYIMTGNGLQAYEGITMSRENLIELYNNIVELLNG